VAVVATATAMLPFPIELTAAAAVARGDERMVAAAAAYLRKKTWNALVPPNATDVFASPAWNSDRWTQMFPCIFGVVTATATTAAAAGVQGPWNEAFAYPKCHQH
jgi:hypothetical protein